MEIVTIGESGKKELQNVNNLITYHQLDFSWNVCQLKCK